jgi:hypothetical protein
LKINGEYSSVDREASEKGHKAVLFYNAQHNRTLANEVETCLQGNKYKDNLTLLFCYNAQRSESYSHFCG